MTFALTTGPAVAVIATGVFGLLIGSFANVLVYRLPAGISVVAPASACPRCGRGIRAWDNIPVLSWLLLRGKCRDCGGPIAARYPLVEFGMGAFFAIAAAWWWLVQFGGENAQLVGPTPMLVSRLILLIAFLYLATVSVVLGLIDVDTHTLPNRIVLPSYLVAIIAFAVATVLDADATALLRAAIGLIALWLLYLVLAIVYPGGMGFGDVKLAGLLGLYLGWVGWGPLVVGGFAAFLLGGLFSIVLLATRRAGRKSGIPFGPWMLAGAWLGIFFGTAIWNAYLTMIGLSLIGAG
ncbi:MAG: prepilin peptidase [Microbacteriaceae bacterium]|nr:MAG: prepilin peptidase [Microbacteriaceae bacterium]